MRAIMCEMSLETFYIINQMPKINRAHWNLPWMSCILKFRSLKISLETLERSFHRGEKTEICREASWDIRNSPLSGNSSYPSSSYRGSTVLNPPESDRVLAYSCRIPSTICDNDYSYVSSKQKETNKWFSMHLEVSCSYIGTIYKLTLISRVQRKSILQLALRASFN